MGEDTDTKCQQIYRFSPPRRAHLPFRLSVEESTGRMDVDHLLVDQRPVTLLRVFLGSVPKEPTADGLLHADCGLATGDHIQLVSVRNISQDRMKRWATLFSEVLSSRIMVLNIPISGPQSRHQDTPSRPKCTTGQLCTAGKMDAVRARDLIQLD